jgi:ribonucleoside-diphosphate reductase alpha chain
VSEATKEIVDKEALIGVGITGWMNNPDILFNKEVMKKGAEIVKHWNKITANLIGINQAARTTVVKPSGNASVLLGCASGIHGEHAPRYIRHVQMNKETEVGQLFAKSNPSMVETSVWSDLDYVIAFPIEPKEGSIYKKDLLGVKQLEYVKLAQDYWIEYGTNHELCVAPYLKHNVSNTITVDDWDEVTRYIYDNRKSLCGISLLAAAGDRAYPQSPFTEVLTEQQILDLYGKVAMFASGLIEAGLTAFNNDLWTACNTALGFGEVLTDEHKDLLKRDFVRRFDKFSTNFKSKEECANCLKDVYNLHKWWKITSSAVPIDWASDLPKKGYTDVSTLGASGCAGSQCEIDF